MIENCLSKVPSTRIVVPAKTVLLEAGAIAKYMYLVRSGCARLWYNNEGEDIIDTSTELTQMFGYYIDEEALKEKLYDGTWSTPRLYHEDGSVADW